MKANSPEESIKTDKFIISTAQHDQIMDELAFICAISFVINLYLILLISIKISDMIETKV
jgi:hypothetical protein